MWDLFVSVPHHCLSFYFVLKPEGVKNEVIQRKKDHLYYLHDHVRKQNIRLPIDKRWVFRIGIIIAVSLY